MLTQLLRNLGIITHKAKRVIICGGGRIGYYLSTWLAKEGVGVLLIEQDEARCEELSGKLPPEVCIIHGDASSQFLLESEGIHDCDAVVTMTGMDEMNMIISLYAQTCGVPQVITKVGHMENNSMQDSLGLGSVICPKELCCNTIVRYVRAMQNTTGAALTLHNIAEGQAEALEFVVDADTKHIGEPLRNIRLKRNILIACISHGSKTEIPNGDSMYEAGNSVIIVAKGGMTLLQLNDIFSEDAMNYKMMGKFLSQILINGSRVYGSGTFNQSVYRKPGSSLRVWAVHSDHCRSRCLNVLFLQKFHPSFFCEGRDGLRSRKLDCNQFFGCLPFVFSGNSKLCRCPV